MPDAMTTDAMLADMANVDAHSELWRYDPSDHTWSLTIGRLTMTVKRGHQEVNALWSVDHDQAGVLIVDIPADNTIIGRRDAIAWCRRWLSQHA